MTENYQNNLKKIKSRKPMIKSSSSVDINETVLDKSSNSSFETKSDKKVC